MSPSAVKQLMGGLLRFSSVFLYSVAQPLIARVASSPHAAAIACARCLTRIPPFWPRGDYRRPPNRPPPNPPPPNPPRSQPPAPRFHPPPSPQPRFAKLALWPKPPPHLDEPQAAPADRWSPAQRAFCSALSDCVRASSLTSFHEPLP